MADDKNGEESPMKTVFILAALLGGLIILWYVNGGPERSDLRGIFLSPPSPVGSGDAYGPQIGTPSESAPQAIEQPTYDY